MALLPSTLLRFIYDWEMCKFYSIWGYFWLENTKFVSPCGSELWKADLNFQALAFWQIWVFCLLGWWVLLQACFIEWISGRQWKARRGAAVSHMSMHYSFIKSSQTAFQILAPSCTLIRNVCILVGPCAQSLHMVVAALCLCPFLHTFLVVGVEHNFLCSKHLPPGLSCAG